MIDTVINKSCHIAAELDRDGVGVVYRGHDQLLKRTAAVNVLNNSELGCEDSAHLRCLLNKTPDDRPQSADQIAETLQQIALSQPVSIVSNYPSSINPAKISGMDRINRGCSFGGEKRDLRIPLPGDVRTDSHRKK